MAITEQGLGRALDPQEFAYFLHMTFRGITISERSAGFNIIVRSYDRQGKAVYAMAQADHPVEGILKLLNALSGRGGEALWRLDKYAR